MSLLLNRKYGSRLECLYYILRSCYAKFGTEKEFALKDLKYDEDDKYNVHNYCKLLQDCVGMKCCPFLVNPLNDSKCYATQSIYSDSTKSKAVSDIGGSFEALGFAKKTSKNKYKITKQGEKWVNTDFSSKEWGEIALQGVLSYGVIIGFLNKIKDCDDIFSYSGIYLGYPQTKETVEYTDDKGSTKYVDLSTDSQRDSNTRTMSRIIGWCVTVGLLQPIIKDNNHTTELAHLRYREFINSGELTIRKFKKTQLCKDIFDNKFYVSNPLSYMRLHKDVKALRENGGETLRRATMAYNQNILNRRFVFVYVLNYFSKINKPLNFEKLIEEMCKYEKLFFSSGNSPYDIMVSESEISDIVGLPFKEENGLLYALTTIDENILKEDSPVEVINIADKIAKELEKE